jgi:hypothetical protein
MIDLAPIIGRCNIPNRADAAERALTVRIALLEAVHRYRLELTAALKHLQDAIEEDRSDLIDDATGTIERLRRDIRHLTEELSLS